MFVKMLENLNVIEEQLDEYGYEIGDINYWMPVDQ